MADQQVVKIGGSFVCPVCLQNFAKKFNAQRHITLVHSANAEISMVMDEDSSIGVSCENDIIVDDDFTNNDIENLLLETVNNDARQPCLNNPVLGNEEFQNSSDEDDNEEALSIEDDWVFKYSKLSIKRALTFACQKKTRNI